MKLIVSRSDRIDVTVYCFEVEGMLQATYLKENIPKGTEEVEEAVFTFREPNHADSQSIFKQCDFKPDLTGEGDNKYNVANLQDVILQVLLVDWDLKDEKGEKLAVQSGNVNSLHPSVARAAAVGCLDKVRL